MHYFLEIPCKNYLFVGEIGHGVQQWRTVCNFAILKTECFIFLGSVLHTQDICWGFPNAAPFTQPCFPALPPSLSLHLQHTTPKSGYWPDVKIVPQVGVLPKMKTLLSLLSLPFFFLFLFTVFFKLVFSGFYLTEAKYVIFAPITWFVCLSPTALLSPSGDEFWAFCFPCPFSRFQ